jgi:hypothetical protein
MSRQLRAVSSTATPPSVARQVHSTTHRQTNKLISKLSVFWTRIRRPTEVAYQTLQDLVEAEQADEIFGVEVSLSHVVLSPALPFKGNSTRSSSTIISDDSDFSRESASHSELCNDINSSSAGMTCLEEEVHVEDRHVDAEKDVYADCSSHSRQFSYTASIFEVESKWSLMADMALALLYVESEEGDWDRDQETVFKKPMKDESNSYKLPSLSSRSISRQDLEDFLNIPIAA